MCRSGWTANPSPNCKVVANRFFTQAADAQAKEVAEFSFACGLCERNSTLQFT